MNHATTCKFCKLPITVTIDDDYAALGDPYKLIPLGACNHCSDVRVERRRLETKISMAVSRMVRAGKLDEDEKKEHAEGLSLLLKDYARMIARWHRKEGMCWDDEIVNSVMKFPEKWTEFLGRLWRMYRLWARQEELAV